MYLKLVDMAMHHFLLLSSPCVLRISEGRLWVTSLQGSEEPVSYGLSDLFLIVGLVPGIVFEPGFARVLQSHGLLYMYRGADERFVGCTDGFHGEGHDLKHMHHQYHVSLATRKRLWQESVTFTLRNQSSILDSLLLLTPELRRRYRSSLLGVDTLQLPHMKQLYWETIRQSMPQWFVHGLCLFAFGRELLLLLIKERLYSFGFQYTMGWMRTGKPFDCTLADDLSEPLVPMMDWIVISYLKQRRGSFEPMEDFLHGFLGRLHLPLPMAGAESTLYHVVHNLVERLQECYTGDVRYLKYPPLKVDKGLSRVVNLVSPSTLPFDYSSGQASPGIVSG